jgi:hypothetical protein
MSSKAKDEMHLKPFFESFMDDDNRLSLKLTIFASNIKLKLFGVLDFFLSFLRTYENKKTHNMLSLILHLRFKRFCPVSSYVSKEQGVSIVEEYDRRMLYSLLVKSYNHLNPLGDVAFGFANQDAN